MATIKQYSKKDGSKAWQFKTYLGMDSSGKRVETTRRGFKTKKEAQLSLSRVKLQYDNGEYGRQQDNSIKTFQEVYELWKENYEMTVKESSFVKVTSQYKVHILPVFGFMKIDSITIADVQKFANDKSKKFVNYRDFISSVSRIFEYAISLNIVSDNPVKRITIPKRIDNVNEEKKINYYTKDELKEFLACCKESQPYYIFAFFQVLSASGCRQGEILGLQWKYVDFEENCIHINQTLARGKDRRLYLEQPKTKHSKRSISLDSTTMNILKQWRIEQKEYMFKLGHNTTNKDQLVFSNIDNSFMQLTKPRKWMLQNMSKHNLRIITIHGFRHTHATLLLEAGVEPKTISERLGHSSIQITLDLYSHVTKQMEKKVPDIFAKVME